MLGHTLDLINERYMDGLEQLLDRGVEVDCIMAKPDPKYFSEYTCCKIKELAEKLKLLCYEGAHVYLEAEPQQFSVLIDGFTQAGFCYKNMVSIPLNNVDLNPHHEDEENCNCFHDVHSTNFYSFDEKHVLFFTAGRPRWFNFTKLFVNKGSNLYPANWYGYFVGDRVLMYEWLMKIATPKHGTILDPFMGTADIGAAAIHADRHYIGIEGSYLFKHAKNRLEHTGE